MSLQTVSRVINDEPNVRPAMKRRVQDSIDKLDYVPSIAAQRMSGSRSYLILALNDRERTIAEWQARQGSDWVGQMLLGGMLKSAELGYRMIFELVDTHSDHIARELRSTIAALQPDGVILTPPHSDNPIIVDILSEQNIPFAQIGSSGSGAGIPIIMGDEDAANLATTHLIELGHEHIGFIAGPDSYQLSAWRKAGWLKAMEGAGLSTDGLCADGDFSRESGTQAARKLLSGTPRPTAILASNDQMALAAMDVAQENGLSVPEDISVISFDNSPATRYAQPKLTVIDQPIAQTVSKAVELIVSAKKGEVHADGPVIIPAGFIERESTAPPPDGG